MTQLGKHGTINRHPSIYHPSSTLLGSMGGQRITRMCVCVGVGVGV